MEKYGYQDKIFNIYLSSFCKKQQVKLAAKEIGFVKEQKLHFKKNNVSWYRIDSSPVLNIFFSTSEILKISTLIFTISRTRQ